MLLEDVKEMVETDLEETIFDKQLTIYIRSGSAYLKNNSIPVPDFEKEDEEIQSMYKEPDDYHLVLYWLHFHVIRVFDKEISATTLSFIQEEMINTLYQLKIKYSRSVKDEV